MTKRIDSDGEKREKIDRPRPWPTPLSNGDNKKTKDTDTERPERRE